MSKNKKLSNKSKSTSHQKLKGVNKNTKKKIAFKQNVKVKTPKSEKNVKDQVISKSKKKKRNKKIPEDFVLDLKDQQKLNFNSSPKSQLPKKHNFNKLKALLDDKKKETKVKKNTVPLTLRERMFAQLKASRFRFLNEQLYSNQSSDTKKYFEDDPGAFYAYHEGYKHQVERWPINPLDIIIESIKKMPKDYIIADFGCGEAKLADSVPQKVHSFDLVSVNEKVQACDMSNTPLLTGRTNVVVFCLSLMGSNLGDYLLEANRVLDKDGILKIAEVESRFNKIDGFLKIMNQYGFVNTWKDLSNNLFYFMDFKKTRDILKKDADKLPAVTLKPCLYKKR